MDLNAIAAAAAQGDNQTDTASAPKERKLPEAGKAFAVLKDYIELGYHDKRAPYNGVDRKLMLTFELNHPKHMIEGEPQLFTVRVNISNSDKGKFMPLFRALNYDNSATHMTQLIGRKYLVDIVHRQGNDGKTYANVDNNGAWTFQSPIFEDPMSGEKQDLSAKIPDLKGEPRVFVWENAAITDEQYLEMWNSIYIESNNFIQEIIQTSNKYSDSRLASLINGVGNEEVNQVVNPDFEPDF